MDEDNPYTPVPATITEANLESGGERAIRTFRVKFDDDKKGQDFVHRPGQFIMVSVYGTGEAPFAVSMPPLDENLLEFTVMRTGTVTKELHKLREGDKVGIRGPYGDGHFPVEDWTGKDLVFIGAGIGLPPLRSVYKHVISDEKREKYGEVTLIHGARTSDDLLYKDELERLGERGDIDLWRCIDWRSGEEGLIEESAEDGWEPINMEAPGDTELESDVRRYTAFVPQLVRAVEPRPENAIALICGPPIAIKLTIEAVQDLGWAPAQIFTTLENRMKCGIGKCGRCNIGKIYVCEDGPVFNYEQLKAMKPETPLDQFG